MDEAELQSDFDVWLELELDFRVKIHCGNGGKKRLNCSMDPRLLRRILDRRFNWNSAEIGCHIQFYRTPNEYDINIHTGLSMFHL